MKASMGIRLRAAECMENCGIGNKCTQMGRTVYRWIDNCGAVNRCMDVRDRVMDIRNNVIEWLVNTFEIMNQHTPYPEINQQIKQQFDGYVVTASVIKPLVSGWTGSAITGSMNALVPTDSKAFIPITLIGSLSILGIMHHYISIMKTHREVGVFIAALSADPKLAPCVVQHMSDTQNCFPCSLDPDISKCKVATKVIEAISTLKTDPEFIKHQNRYKMSEWAIFSMIPITSGMWGIFSSFSQKEMNGSLLTVALMISIANMILPFVNSYFRYQFFTETVRRIQSSAPGLEQGSPVGTSYQGDMDGTQHPGHRKSAYRKVRSGVSQISGEASRTASRVSGMLSRAFGLFSSVSKVASVSKAVSSAARAPLQLNITPPPKLFGNGDLKQQADNPLISPHDMKDFMAQAALKEAKVPPLKDPTQTVIESLQRNAAEVSSEVLGMGHPINGVLDDKKSVSENKGLSIAGSLRNSLQGVFSEVGSMTDAAGKALKEGKSVTEGGSLGAHVQGFASQVQSMTQGGISSALEEAQMPPVEQDDTYAEPTPAGAPSLPAPLADADELEKHALALEEGKQTGLSGENQKPSRVSPKPPQIIRRWSELGRMAVRWQAWFARK